jgi:hypothetical protein
MINMELLDTIKLYQCDMPDCNAIGYFSITNNQFGINYHYCDLHFSIYADILSKSLKNNMNKKEKCNYKEILRKCVFR